ncbi:MAG: cation:proton antiporter [Eubacteriales bacterium]
MESYGFIFDLAMILLSTKVMGVISKKFQMPQVVGALLAGLVFGPACLNIIQDTSFIEATAEIGVIVLMFGAGMETDIKELKKSGKASFVIAIFGVLVPLAGGYLVADYFNQAGRIASDASGSIVLQNVFMGIILTATSVSITVETLKEMGKLKTRSGNAILGAAIIDDILGIVGLTIVTSFTDASVSIVLVLLKTAGFFVFAGVAGVIFYKVYRYWSESEERDLHRHTIIALVFCLLMSYIAEEVFGVADITGAFVAGLILANTRRSHYIAAKFDVISYLYLSPIFFASIGLQVELPAMTGTIVAFSAALVVVAVLTKIIGCGVGAKLCGYQNYQCVRIGTGMVSRGEVALIVASKGAALGLVGSNFMGPIVVVVVITTIITPVMLKVVFKKGPAATALVEEPGTKGLSHNYEMKSTLRQLGASDVENLIIKNLYIDKNENKESKGNKEDK